MGKIADIAKIFGDIYSIGNAAPGVTKLLFNNGNTLSLEATPTSSTTLTLPTEDGNLHYDLEGFYTPRCVAFSHFTNINKFRGFITNNSGSNATQTANAAPSATQPGIVISATGNTNTGRAGIGTAGVNIRLGFGRCLLRVSVMIPTLSASTQRFEIMVGFADISTAIPNHGIHFWYSDNINSGKWQARTSAATVATTQDTGVTIVANTWYDMIIDINAAATNADFYINGSLVNSITTNIPTAAGQEMRLGFYIRKTVGTSGRTIHCDKMFYSLNE